ncbi:LuxR C-terminal-related transcriptional regulator [Mycolicibacterium sp. CAU 1645]|uniref:LuxR C-terminal-related transcriptional regulator n=2 Tax=Mycolicibacterium arenosum TaxID=2952157 RepID=A0ABT1LXD1_9MYCO|nr:LuxR C-terminal-related transcriptional regulator [Mycolicibacterium sp. CAU 1645]
MVGRGLTDAEIAQQSFLNVDVVRVHLIRIMAKCDVQDRSELATMAREAGAWQEARGTESSLLAAKLNPRERDLLALVAQGFTDAQIDARTPVAGATEQRVRALMAKLGLSQREQLVQLADEMGLVHSRDTERGATAPARSVGAAPAGLNDDERRVVILLARGLSETEIAGRLSVSATVVDRLLNQAMAKLGAADRVGLVVAAFGMRLVIPTAMDEAQESARKLLSPSEIESIRLTVQLIDDAGIDATLFNGKAGTAERHLRAAMLKLGVDERSQLAAIAIGTGLVVTSQQVAAQDEFDRKVARLVTVGRTDLEIAGQLAISPAAVRVAVDRVMHRLGVHDRRQLAAIGYERGLVPIRRGATRAQVEAAKLTVAERQVLALVGQGLPNPEIDKRLRVRSGSADSVLNTLMLKLRVREAELVRIYHESAAGLTDPELQVLALLADGRSVGQISRALSFSEQRVALALGSAMQKLGASNYVELTENFRRADFGPPARPEVTRRTQPDRAAKAIDERTLAGFHSRQKQVVVMFGLGLAENEIAKRLSRPVWEVERHLQTAALKVGLRNREALRNKLSESSLVRPVPEAEAQSALSGLSGRETMLVGLIADGLSDTQIDKRMSWTSGTAKDLVRDILRKSGAPTRTQLMALAYQQPTSVSAGHATSGRGIALPPAPERVRLGSRQVEAIGLLKLNHSPAEVLAVLSVPSTGARTARTQYRKADRTTRRADSEYAPRLGDVVDAVGPALVDQLADDLTGGYGPFRVEFSRQAPQPGQGDGVRLAGTILDGERYVGSIERRYFRDAHGHVVVENVNIAIYDADDQGHGFYTALESELARYYRRSRADRLLATPTAAGSYAAARLGHGWDPAKLSDSLERIRLCVADLMPRVGPLAQAELRTLLPRLQPSHPELPTPALLAALRTDDAPRLGVDLMTAAGWFAATSLRDNCAHEAAAWLSEWCGRDMEVSVRPSTRGVPSRALFEAAGSAAQRATYNDVQQTLLSMPSESSAILVSSWALSGTKAGGHAYVAVHVDGQLYYYDPATGELADWPPVWGDRAVATTAVGYLRPDGSPVTALDGSADELTAADEVGPVRGPADDEPSTREQYRAQDPRARFVEIEHADPLHVVIAATDNRAVIEQWAADLSGRYGPFRLSLCGWGGPDGVHLVGEVWDSGRYLGEIERRFFRDPAGELVVHEVVLRIDDAEMRDRVSLHLEWELDHYYWRSPRIRYEPEARDGVFRDEVAQDPTGRPVDTGSAVPLGVVVDNAENRAVVRRLASELSGSYGPFRLALSGTGGDDGVRIVGTVLDGDQPLGTVAYRFHRDANGDLQVVETETVFSADPSPALTEFLDELDLQLDMLYRRSGVAGIEIEAEALPRDPWVAPAELQASVDAVYRRVLDGLVGDSLARDHRFRPANSLRAELLTDLLSNVGDHERVTRFADDLSGVYGSLRVEFAAVGYLTAGRPHIALSGEIFDRDSHVGDLRRVFFRDDRDRLVVFEAALSTGQHPLGWMFVENLGVEMGRYYLRAGVAGVQRYAVVGDDGADRALDGFTWILDATRLGESMENVQAAARGLLATTEGDARQRLDAVVEWSALVRWMTEQPWFDPDRVELVRRGDLAGLRADLDAIELVPPGFLASLHTDDDPDLGRRLMASTACWVEKHLTANCAHTVANALSDRYLRRFVVESPPSELGVPARDLFVAAASGAELLRSYDDVRARLKKLGPGSSAVLASAWAPGGARSGGHAYFAVNDGGQIYLIDPHTGRRSGWPPAWGEEAVTATAVAYLDDRGYPIKPLYDPVTQLDAVAERIGLVRGRPTEPTADSAIIVADQALAQRIPPVRADHLVSPLASATLAAERARANVVWWDGLTTTQQDAVKKAYPWAIGNADGVPAQVRHQVNSTVLQQMHAELAAAAERGEPMPRAMRKLAAWLDRVDRALRDAAAKAEAVGIGAPLLLSCDPLAFGGRGRVVLSFGADPDEAQSVSWHISGDGAVVDRLDTGLSDALNQLRSTQTEDPQLSAASIAWVGFDGSSRWQRARRFWARMGGDALHSAIGGFNASREMWAGDGRPFSANHLFARGGAAAEVGYAAAGRRLDGMVRSVTIVGRADALPLGHARDVGPDIEVFVAVSSSERGVRGRGPDPAAGAFGAKRVTAEFVGEQADYYGHVGQTGAVRGEALANMGRVAAGKLDTVERERHRIRLGRSMREPAAGRVPSLVPSAGIPRRGLRWPAVEYYRQDITDRRVDSRYADPVGELIAGPADAVRAQWLADDLSGRYGPYRVVLRGWQNQDGVHLTGAVFDGRTYIGDVERHFYRTRTGDLVVDGSTMVEGGTRERDEFIAALNAQLSPYYRRSRVTVAGPGDRPAAAVTAATVYRETSSSVRRVNADHAEPIAWILHDLDDDVAIDRLATDLSGYYGPYRVELTGRQLRHRNRESAVFSGRVLNGEQFIGQIHLGFFRNGDGALCVFEDGFQLDDAFTGRGFREALERELRRYYRRSGIEYRLRHTSFEGNGHRRALEGETWSSRTDHLEQSLDGVRRSIQSLAGDVDERALPLLFEMMERLRAGHPLLPKSAELATLSAPGEDDLGQKVMAGLDWWSVQRLRNCAIDVVEWARAFYMRPGWRIDAEPTANGLPARAMFEAVGSSAEFADYEEIERRLLHLGHGASALIASAWSPAGTGGHAYAAVNDHGRVLLVDVRAGIPLDWPPYWGQDAVTKSAVGYLNADGTPLARLVDPVQQLAAADDIGDVAGDLRRRAAVKAYLRGDPDARVVRPDFAPPLNEVVDGVAASPDDQSGVDRLADALSGIYGPCRVSWQGYGGANGVHLFGEVFHRGRPIGQIQRHAYRNGDNDLVVDEVGQFRAAALPDEWFAAPVAAVLETYFRACGVAYVHTRWTTGGGSAAARRGAVWSRDELDVSLASVADAADRLRPELSGRARLALDEAVATLHAGDDNLRQPHQLVALTVPGRADLGVELMDRTEGRGIIPLQSRDFASTPLRARWLHVAAGPAHLAVRALGLPRVRTGTLTPPQVNAAFDEGVRQLRALDDQLVEGGVGLADRAQILSGLHGAMRTWLQQVADTWGPKQWFDGVDPTPGFGSLVAQHHAAGLLGHDAYTAIIEAATDSGEGQVGADPRGENCGVALMRFIRFWHELAFGEVVATREGVAARDIFALLRCAPERDLTYQQVRTRLMTMPPGSTAVLTSAWAEGGTRTGGHGYLAVRAGDGVWLFDPHTGRWSDWPPFWGQTAVVRTAVGFLYPDGTPHNELSGAAQLAPAVDVGFVQGGGDTRDSSRSNSDAGSDDEQLPAPKGWRDFAAGAVLTELRPREREVLALFAAALTTSQIADRLSIEEEVAAGHITRLQVKLGVPDPRLLAEVADAAGYRSTAALARVEVSDERVLAARLTESERTMWALVGQGLGNPAIAAELGIAESTVKRTCSELRRKLGAASRAQLAAWAHHRDLLEVNWHETSSAVPADAKAALTGGETEVVRLLAEGHTDSDIARHWRIRLDTVEGLVRRAVAKLGMRDRAELVAMAYANGLVTAEAAEPDGFTDAEAVAGLSGSDREIMLWLARGLVAARVDAKFTYPTGTTAKAVERLLDAMRLAEPTQLVAMAYQLLWDGPSPTATPLPARLAAKLRQLSPLERRVVTLLGRGRATAQIDVDLKMAAGSVRRLLAVIMQKLGVQASTQVVTVAYRAGLVSTPRVSAASTAPTTLTESAVQAWPVEADPAREAMRSQPQSAQTSPHSTMSSALDRPLAALTDEERNDVPVLNAEQIGELTDTEQAVFARLVAGASTAQIAAELTTSESAVGKHVGSLLRKLAIDNPVQLAALAHRWSVIPATPRGHTAGIAPEAVNSLTSRELDVLALLVVGLTPNHIAARLSTSLNNIKQHVHRICKKLGVQSRTQLVVMAYEHGFVRPETPGDARSAPTQRRVVLTTRLNDVAALLVEGRTPAAIAEQLSVSEHTAQGYISELLRSLDVYSRGRLVTVALRHNMLTPNATGHVRVSQRTRRAANDFVSSRRRVMALLAEGHPVDDVAAHLSLPVASVSQHVDAVLRKLGANSRAHVLGLALRAGDLTTSVFGQTADVLDPERWLGQEMLASVVDFHTSCAHGIAAAVGLLYGRKCRLDTPPSLLGVRARTLFKAVGTAARLTTYADVERSLLAGGHGASAVLASSWVGGAGTGHAYFAINNRGRIRLLDPHTGMWSDWPPSWGPDAVADTAVGHLRADGTPVIPLDGSVGELAAADAVGRVRGPRDETRAAYRREDRASRFVNLELVDPLGVVVDHAHDESVVAQFADDLAGRYGRFRVALVGWGGADGVHLSGQIDYADGERVGEFEWHFYRDGNGLVAREVRLATADPRLREWVGTHLDTELSYYFERSGGVRYETATDHRVDTDRAEPLSALIYDLANASRLARLSDDLSGLYGTCRVSFTARASKDMSQLRLEASVFDDGGRRVGGYLAVVEEWNAGELRLHDHEEGLDTGVDDVQYLAIFGELERYLRRSGIVHPQRLALAAANPWALEHLTWDPSRLTASRIAMSASVRAVIRRVVGGEAHQQLEDLRAELQNGHLPALKHLRDLATPDAPELGRVLLARSVGWLIQDAADPDSGRVETRGQGDDELEDGYVDSRVVRRDGADRIDTDRAEAVGDVLDDHTTADRVAGLAEDLSGWYGSCRVEVTVQATPAGDASTLRLEARVFDGSRRVGGFLATVFRDDGGTLTVFDSEQGFEGRFDDEHYIAVFSELERYFRRCGAEHRSRLLCAGEFRSTSLAGWDPDPVRLEQSLASVRMCATSLIQKGVSVEARLRLDDVLDRLKRGSLDVPTPFELMNLTTDDEQDLGRRLIARTVGWLTNGHPNCGVALSKWLGWRYGRSYVVTATPTAAGLPARAVFEAANSAAQHVQSYDEVTAELLRRGPGHCAIVVSAWAPSNMRAGGHAYLAINVDGQIRTFDPHVAKTSGWPPWWGQHAVSTTAVGYLDAEGLPMVPLIDVDEDLAAADDVGLVRGGSEDEARAAYRDTEPEHRFADSRFAERLGDVVDNAVADNAADQLASDLSGHYGPYFVALRGRGGPDGVLLSGRIRDGGRRVGEFRRHYYRDDEGALVVRDFGLMINDVERRDAVRTHIKAELDDFYYLRSGVDRVETGEVAPVDTDFADPLGNVLDALDVLDDPAGADLIATLVHDLSGVYGGCRVRFSAHARPGDHGPNLRLEAEVFDGARRVGAVLATVFRDGDGDLMVFDSEQGFADPSDDAHYAAVFGELESYFRASGAQHRRRLGGYAEDSAYAAATWDPDPVRLEQSLASIRQSALALIEQGVSVEARMALDDILARLEPGRLDVPTPLGLLALTTPQEQDLGWQLIARTAGWVADKVPNSAVALTKWLGRLYGRSLAVIAEPTAAGLPPRVLFEALNSTARVAQSYDEVAAELQRLGPRHCAVLVSVWAQGGPERGAHAYLAINVDGQIKLFDPRLGTTTGWPPFWGQDAVAQTVVGYLDADGNPMHPLIDAEPPLRTAGEAEPVRSAGERWRDVPTGNDPDGQLARDALSRRVPPLTPATLTGLSGSVQAVAEPARANTAWWASLDGTRQRAVLDAYPHAIGNADGIPVAARHEANMAVLRELCGGDGSRRQRTRWQRLSRLLDAESDDVSGPWLLALDVTGPGGGGRVLVAWGDDPLTADTVSWHVAGPTAKIERLDVWAATAKSQLESARTQAPESAMASIAWLGYTVAAGLDGYSKALQQDSLLAASTRLRADIQAFTAAREMWAADGHRFRGNHVFGHRWGATVAAYAGAGGRLASQVRSVTFDDSPGAGPLRHARELGHGVGVYVAAASHSRIASLGGRTPGSRGRFGFGVGADAAMGWFGAVRVTAESAAEAQTNFGRIAAGATDRINHEPHRDVRGGRTVDPAAGRARRNPDAAAARRWWRPRWRRGSYFWQDTATRKVDHRQVIPLGEVVDSADPGRIDRLAADLSGDYGPCRIAYRGWAQSDGIHLVGAMFDGDRHIGDVERIYSRNAKGYLTVREARVDPAPDLPRDQFQAVIDAMTAQMMPYYHVRSGVLGFAFGPTDGSDVPGEAHKAAAVVAYRAQSPSQRDVNTRHADPLGVILDSVDGPPVAQFARDLSGHYGPYLVEFTTADAGNDETLTVVLDGVILNGTQRIGSLQLRFSDLDGEFVVTETGFELQETFRNKGFEAALTELERYSLRNDVDRHEAFCAPRGTDGYQAALRGFGWTADPRLRQESVDNLRRLAGELREHAEPAARAALDRVLQALTRSSAGLPSPLDLAVLANEPGLARALLTGAEWWGERQLRTNCAHGVAEVLSEIYDHDIDLETVPTASGVPARDLYEALGSGAEVQTYQQVFERLRELGALSSAVLVSSWADRGAPAGGHAYVAFNMHGVIRLYDPHTRLWSDWPPAWGEDAVSLTAAGYLNADGYAVDLLFEPAQLAAAERVGFVQGPPSVPERPLGDVVDSGDAEGVDQIGFDLSGHYGPLRFDATAVSWAGVVEVDGIVSRRDATVGRFSATIFRDRDGRLVVDGGDVVLAPDDVDGPDGLIALEAAVESYFFSRGVDRIETQAGPGRSAYRLARRDFGWKTSDAYRLRTTLRGLARAAFDLAADADADAGLLNDVARRLDRQTDVPAPKELANLGETRLGRTLLDRVIGPLVKDRQDDPGDAALRAPRNVAEYRARGWRDRHADPRFAADLGEVVDNRATPDILARFARDLSGHYGPFPVKFSASVAGEKVVLVGAIYFGAQRVGRIRHNFYRDSDGRLVVYEVASFIDIATLRGRGFARVGNAKLEPYYRSCGVDRIEAGLSGDGSVLAARRGFTWPRNATKLRQSLADVRRAARDLERIVTGEDAKAELRRVRGLLYPGRSDLPEPGDLVSLEVDSDRLLGWHLMHAAQWWGEKPMDHATAARRIRVEDVPLTSRQLEVALALAAGRTDAEIAAELLISKVKVQRHCRKVVARLGVADRVGVVAWVQDRGLLGAARTGPARVTALSAREREVLTLVGQGFDNDELAARLSASSVTVARWVRAIAGKLGVQARTQLAVTAYDAGLVSAHPRIDRPGDDVLATLSLPSGALLSTPGLTQLNRRERAVLALVGAGLTDIEIDARMSGDPGTAHRTVRDVLTKLGARERLQLVTTAWDTGLVTSVRTGAAAPSLTALTPRGREVTALLAGGMADAEIASQLSTSAAAVKTQLQSAIRILGARDRAHLTVIAFRAGLVSPDPARALCLTDAERDVLALLAEGLPNREIATRLQFGINATERHVGRLLRTFGVKGRSQVVAKAHHMGLLSVPPDSSGALRRTLTSWPARQQLAVRLFAGGLSPDEIAAKLETTVTGINRYLDRAMSDWGAEDRIGLVALAHRASLSEADDGTLPSVELSSRERRILELTGAGGAATEISAELGVDKHTVRTDLGSLRRKFGVTSNPNLVIAAFRNGTLRPRADMSGTLAGKLALLAVREKRVLSLAARGKSTKEIATRLGTTTESVRQIYREAFDRLGARDLTHAVSLLYDTGALETLTATLAEDAATLVAQRFAKLTDLERAVVVALAHGSTNERIDTQLSLNPGTAASTVLTVMSDAEIDELTTLVALAFRHGLAVPADVVAPAGLRAKLARLNRRESAVFRLLGQSLTTAQIDDKMNVPAGSARRRVDAIMRKLSIRVSTQLVALAHHRGSVGADPQEGDGTQSAAAPDPQSANPFKV